MRIFVGLDVASARQPQACELMIDQQHFSALLIDESEITNQVLGWNVGLSRPQDRRARPNPFERRVAMLPLELVERLDCRNYFGDPVPHQIHPSACSSTNTDTDDKN